MGLEMWGIDKSTLGNLCLILQSLIIGIKTNLKVNVFSHCEMKIYLHFEGFHFLHELNKEN
jgi:hypothetical protein